MSRNDITGDRIASRPASDEFRESFDRIFGAPRRILAPTCKCSKCLHASGETVEVCGMQMPIANTRMVLCAICGNKRCPHAADCALACTDSNESGQPGSNYP